MDQEPKPADIRFLPTDGLEVPDWNPRKTMSVPGLAALKAHVEAGGTIPRIWVWGGDGKSVIAGQRRLTVYRRLGIPLIEAEIFHVSLEEAKRLARTSNRGEALNWLEEYEGWEDYFKGGSKLSDEVIAALEGVEADWIGRARALLAVLNPASRKLIRENLLEDPSKNKGNNDGSEDFGNIKKPLKKRISKNEEKRGLLEDVAFPLTRLWNKRSIQEAQTLVEKALPVILSRQMKGPQVKALVKWVSAGNDPEAFGQAHLSPDPQVGGQALVAPSQSGGGTGATKEGSVHLSPDAQVGGQALVAPSQSGDGYGATQAGSVVNPSPLAGEGRVRGDYPVKAVGASKGERPNQQPEIVHQPEGLSMVGQGPTTTSLSPNAPIGAAPRNDNGGQTQEVDLHTQVGTAIAGHELGKRLHLPTQLMNRLLPGLTRLFHRARGLFARVGIKNPTWATFLTLLFFLFVGSALINLTGRLMNGLWNGFAYSFISTSTQVGRQAGVSGNGDQVSSRSGEGTGAKKVGSADLPSGLVGAPPLPPITSSGVQAPNPSRSPAGQPPLPPIDSSGAPAKSASTPAKGGDVLVQIGAGVKSYQSAVNRADQAKLSTDKVKGLLGF